MRGFSRFSSPFGLWVTVTLLHGVLELPTSFSDVSYCVQDIFVPKNLHFLDSEKHVECLKTSVPEQRECICSITKRPHHAEK